MRRSQPAASGDDGEQTKASRRRGAELERAILQAAAQELTESGYAGLTMDRVAARAGTSKNVIYRRWPNRAALGVAAYRQMLPRTPQAPDTGDLRSDALAVLRRVNDRMSSPLGKTVQGLLSGVQDDPDLLREVREQLVQASISPWLTVLARAVARNEARPEALTPRIATVAVNLLRNEYALNGLTEVPDSVIVEIIDDVYLPLVQVRTPT